MKKINFLAAIVFLLIAGCGTTFERGEIIRVKGSDTMLRLTEKLAREYMKESGDVSIYVQGGGSATGAKALAEGGVDIAMTSRPLEPSEVKELSAKYSTVGLASLIAKDALSVYINRNNPVQNFALEELRSVFTCGIKNWKELGGEDLEIQVVLRPPNSGTYLYLKRHILKNDDYCSSAKTRATTSGVVEAVSENFGAIGYGGLGYGGDKIVKAKVEGVAPTEENALKDKYPISRYLYFYTIDKPKGAVKRFIEWTLSPKGQKVIEESGYISIWDGSE